MTQAGKGAGDKEAASGLAGSFTYSEALVWHAYPLALARQAAPLKPHADLRRSHHSFPLK